MYDETAVKIFLFSFQQLAANQMIKCIVSIYYTLNFMLSFLEENVYCVDKKV